MHHPFSRIGLDLALIVRCARAAAAFGPDTGQAALLADARFILPPELDGLVKACSGMTAQTSLAKFFMRLLGFEILLGMAQANGDPGEV